MVPSSYDQMTFPPVMTAALDPAAISTNRIRFRRLKPDDYQLLYQLNNDEGVMEFLDHEPPSPGKVKLEVQQLIDDYARWPEFGRWIAETPTGGFLGWFSLTPREPERLFTLELGYRLRRQSWSKGLATEGSRRLIEHAFLHNSTVERIIGTTMFVNERSRRVMEKCGMRYRETFHLEFEDPLPGTEWGEVLYEITRDEWNNQQLVTAC